MRRDQFAATLESFFVSPQPYRHLYVWHGEVDDLMSLLPPNCVQPLDIFQLAGQLGRHPFPQDEANEVLRDQMRARLREWLPARADTHPVVVVSGCELLARYRVDLQPFYEVLTERSMVILACSAADASYDPAGRLPGYVRCEPSRTLAYLSRLVEDNHVIEARGTGENTHEA
jgi:hypothetical protein